MRGALGEKVKEISDAFNKTQSEYKIPPVYKCNYTETINADARKQAGLDPAKAPATWRDLGDAGKKLQAAGLLCGFTTDWQSWIQLENLSAWNNVPFVFFFLRFAAPPNISPFPPPVPLPT